MRFKIVRYLFYTFLSIFQRDCKCFQDVIILPNNTASEGNCAPPFNVIRFSKHAVFFVADNNSDIYLDDCLFTKRSKDPSIVIFRENWRLNELQLRTAIKYTNFNPTIVIVTPHLNPDIVYHPTTKYLLQAHRSTVYFVITTRDTSFGCVNGVFADNVLKIIDHFINIVWHEYVIFNILIELPFVCPGYFVICDDKRPSNYDLYDRTVMSVPVDSPILKSRTIKFWSRLTKDYPVRANIFDRFPTSIRECQDMHYYLTVDEKYTNGLCGMDAFVMHDILSHYQFNVSFPIVSTIDGYGFMYNNVAIGSLGQLLRDEFDISFNSRFMVQYVEEDEILFLHYVYFDSICAILKVPDYLPLWRYAYQFLKPMTWVAIIGVLSLCSMINKMSEIIRRSMGKRQSSSNAIQLIAVATFGWYFNKRVKPSILGGICLIISLIVYALFQGHVNFVYTTLVRNPRIKTLDELHHSDIEIYSSISFYRLLGDDVQSQQLIIRKVEADDILEDGNIATLQRKSDVLLEIRRNFSDQDGWPLMYWVPECYCNNFLSYMTKKGFPFGNEIQSLMMKLQESGFPEAYYRFTQNALRLSVAKTFFKSRSMPRPFIPLDLPEVRISFAILLVGYTVSTIALVVELYWVRRNKKVKFLQ